MISRLPSTGRRTSRKQRLETASLFPFYSKEIPMAHDDTRTYTHKVRRNYQTLLVNLFSRFRHCRTCRSNVRYPFCQQRSSISPYSQKQSRWIRQQRNRSTTRPKDTASLVITQKQSNFSRYFSLYRYKHTRRLTRPSPPKIPLDSYNFMYFCHTAQTQIHAQLYIRKYIFVCYIFTSLD